MMEIKKISIWYCFNLIAIGTLGYRYYVVENGSLGLTCMFVYTVMLISAAFPHLMMIRASLHNSTTPPPQSE